MKIRRIKLTDFRGFAGESEFDLQAECKNLLVYGENGSGKTSLYHSLRDFLRASRTGDSIGP